MSPKPPRQIDTEKFSASLRGRSVDLDGRRLLVTNFHGSQQEQDFTQPANCGGLGRVRHFRRATSPGWPVNPLPIDPACAALSLPKAEILRAQVFQNASCNWRCWYCFVDFKLLSADPEQSEWVTADDLVGRYLAEPDRPAVIDLTGGQPDLVPEWVPWTMQSLTDRGLADEVYLWSDDNLSNDYFWRYLSDKDIELVAGYPMYGRVCCFKGFDPESFAFNTAAAPELFDRQFELFRRLMALGVDLYAYVTLTTPRADGVGDAVRTFVDRLQQVDENLPLRTVPLEIQAFTPVESRMSAVHEEAISHQQTAVEAWQRELENRFSAEARALSVPDVPFASHVA